MRPERLSEFVGQPELKRTLETHILAAKLRNGIFPHTLLVGPPGLGKTTVARTIAAELGGPFGAWAGSTLRKREDIARAQRFMSKNLWAAADGPRCSLCRTQTHCYHAAGYNADGSVFDWSRVKIPRVFVDEIHRIPSKIQEILYPMLEDRIYHTGRVSNDSGDEERWWLPLFTLIGATTQMGLLGKPFLDRFELVLHFKPYLPAECALIAIQTAAGEGMTMSDGAARTVGAMAGGIPRAAVSIARNAATVAVTRGRRTITEDIVWETAGLHGLDQSGLSDLAQRYMQCLKRAHPKVAGLTSIAAQIGEPAETLTEHVEPRLLQMGLIARTPRGRVLTAKGLEYLDQPTRSTENGTTSGRQAQYRHPRPSSGERPKANKETPAVDWDRIVPQDSTSPDDIYFRSSWITGAEAEHCLAPACTDGVECACLCESCEAAKTSDSEKQQRRCASCHVITFEDEIYFQEDKKVYCASCGEDREESSPSSGGKWVHGWAQE